MDEETRNIIRQFLLAFKHYQARTLSLQKGLDNIIRMSSVDRAALDFDRVQILLRTTRQEFDEKMVQKEIAQLEQGFRDDKLARLRFQEAKSSGNPNDLSDLLNELTKKLLAEIGKV